MKIEWEKMGNIVVDHCYLLLSSYKENLRRQKQIFSVTCMY